MMQDLHMHSSIWCWNFDTGKQIGNTLKVLKCGAGEGWKKLIGWIV